jgi:nucleoside-diphosphate-sugar epimerase
MNVLVTGGAGYLGSVLVPKLLARGHGVRVCDLGYFGLGHLRGLKLPIDLVCQDLRSVARSPQRLAELLEGIDCIVHLAAISNDPSAELNPELTDEVNYRVTVALAEAAQRQGIKFVFSSSCSVYGQADGEIDETGDLAPLTAYAVSKVRAEQALSAFATPLWRPVILHNGTLFGYSPRMRFDLVVNILALRYLPWSTTIYGQNRQW